MCFIVAVQLLTPALLDDLITYARMYQIRAQVVLGVLERG